MKTITTMMKRAAFMLATVAVAFTMTSCEDDDRYIARTLEGTWQGDMYVSMNWYGEYRYASSSEVCFLRDPYRYSSGDGYWVDYYNDYYWGGNNYVASHIKWEVTYGVIKIYFVEDDEYVRIYDYSLDDNYFTGYIELYNGERQGFKLYHVTSPNWGAYRNWGYDSYYDDYYYYSNTNSLGMQKSKSVQREAPKREFRLRDK